jgi:diguanylate cyclase (GGDEF)-like protein
MGRALGVLHVTGEAGRVPTQRVVGQLTTLGILAGSRIGTVRAFERTQLQASTDGLTGLLNRRSLEARARRLAGSAYAVAVADIDEFKRLNDTLGHDAGDRALRVFADVLRRSLPAGHHIARWGGEEFVVVLEGRTAQSAFDIAERIRTDLASACQLTHTPQMTVSFGIADSTMGSAFEHLVRIADDALYQSKEGGRNRTTIGDAARVGGTVPRRDADQLASVEVAALTAMV